MKAITERRSIRKYKDTYISKSDIDTILQSGIYAPSAKNRQPWKYYVYTGETKENVLKCMEKGLIRERDGDKLLPQSGFGIPDAFNTLRVMREAPVLILVENTNCVSPYEPVNADDRVKEICDTLSIGASIQNILLTATELGYGTLWIANTCFAYDEIVEAADIKGQLVGAISLGVADESPAMRSRKAFEEVVEYR